MKQHQEKEQLTRSRERVQELGEVFTPAWLVDAILDQFPPDAWGPEPNNTILEPACGDGNFLIAVLDRKIAALPYDPAARGWYVARALSSIYAIDISPENITAARQRLAVAAIKAGAPERVVRWIVEKNIVVGDASPKGNYLTIPVIEYRWERTGQVVATYRTDYGAIKQEAQDRGNPQTTLFSQTPTRHWRGPYADLYTARELRTSRPDTRNKKKTNTKRRVVQGPSHISKLEFRITELEVRNAELEARLAEYESGANNNHHRAQEENR